ncbi:Sugar transporter ERD6-like 16 [Glycine max]|nr:Sugar transporter ERD6-like 16 [Glycine max]
MWRVDICNSPSFNQRRLLLVKKLDQIRVWKMNPLEWFFLAHLLLFVVLSHLELVWDIQHPLKRLIRADLNLSLAEFSMFGSLVTIGAMLGAITSGRITDFIGRKGAMRISTGFCITGWLAVFFSKGSYSLDMGRFFTGYGIGVISYVVPVYIAEIAPKNLRGGLATTNQLLIVTGGSVSFLLGSVINWRELALAGLVPCICLLVGLCFIPESPRWLAKVGREKEFQLALSRLRGKDADISDEAAEILDYIETLESLPKTKLLDLLQSKYVRSVVIGVGLMACQQSVGINGIGFYTAEIFVAAGLSSGKAGTIAYACIQIPFTLSGAILMDKSGRRPLVMVSAAGTFLGCLIAGIAFFLKASLKLDQNLLLEWVPILAVAGVLIYIAAFSIGLGSVPWVIMSEIFPLHLKGTAGSLVVLVAWLGAWVVSYTFNFLMSWSSPERAQKVLDHFFHEKSFPTSTMLGMTSFSTQFVKRQNLPPSFHHHVQYQDNIGNISAQNVAVLFKKMAIEQHKDVESGYLQEPFVQPEEVACKEVGSDESVENGSIGMVLLSTLVAVCGSFTFGNCFSMFGSLVTIGAMLGAISSGRIIDFIGRKGAMRISAGFCITGWLVVFFSKGSYSLDLGRFFTGYDIGVISYVLLIVTGASVSFLLGSVINWRKLALAGKASVLHCWLVGLCFIPESPRWLAKVGREKEFQLALRRLRGKDVDISDEAAEILIYIAAYSIGEGPVPWVIMSEIFPIHVKGIAGSLMVLVNWLGAWIVSYTFNFLMSWSSPGT